MNFSKSRLSLFSRIFLLCAAGISVTFRGTADTWRAWDVFETFHTDISIAYQQASDEWAFWIDRGVFGEAGPLHNPATSVFLATATALREVPEDVGSVYSFLGEAGDRFYLLPAQERPGVLYLGFNGYGIAPQIFTGVFGGGVETVLEDFSGPGDFFLYTAFPEGPEIYMDTRVPSPPYGEYRVSAGGHFHMNWVFIDKGIYVLHLGTRGEFSEGGKSFAEAEPFFFLIDPKPIDWWRLDTFRTDVNESNALPEADISGDGLPNLLAYALGYSPFASDAQQYLPKPEIVFHEGEPRLSLVFRQPKGTPGRADRSDLHYRVQVSSDLINWTDLENAQWEEIAPGEDETPRVRVHDTENPDVENRRFMRLTIEQKETV